MKLGQLFIKEFPTCWATVNNIRAHVEKLNARGFKPDLIIIDYADILRSTRQYDAKRFELQLIYQELRAYASEIDVPIWTASQSNATGECVGFFTDDTAGRIALEDAIAEWDSCLYGPSRVWMPRTCRHSAVSIVPAEIDDVEPGDAIKFDYSHWRNTDFIRNEWLNHGATSVLTERFEINRWRRSGKSNRSADLGGTAGTVGVLYAGILIAQEKEHARHRFKWSVDQLTNTLAINFV